jgi:hypothetical protein
VVVSADKAARLEQLRKMKRLNELRALKTKEPESVDFSAMTAISNIPSSGAKYAGDMWQAITSPAQVGEAIWNLVQGAGEGVGRKAAEFTTGQELDIDPGSKEKYVQALGDYVMNRYGSVDNFKTTVMEDPVGAVADAAGVVMGGGAVTGSKTLSRLGASMEPLGAAVNVARKAGRTVPRGMYESAAKFSTTLPPGQRQQMVDTALKYGVKPTYRGAEKLQKNIDKYNQKIDLLINEATQSGKKVKVDDLLKSVGEVKKKRGNLGFGAVDDVAYIDKLTNDLRRQAFEMGKAYLDPREVQAFKVRTYGDINFDAKHLSGTPVKEEVYKSAARAAKSELESINPRIGEVNKDLSQLYELQPHLSRAANRVENHNIISLDAPAKTGAGYMIGDMMGVPGAGTAVGFTAAALGKPKVKTDIAIQMARAGRPIGAALDAADTMNPAVARLIEAMAGRSLEDEQANGR